ncbi:hypothetical protein AALO_G00116330 [Alosa alosa]|uniref:Uncharacterized protein n=1 Tax=Alosa alosa TaxID=278164 RepID=A0AAV6GQD1_9TELE|nr:hypothetical protein AALO_G00116330 [Alosa alosa]
MEACYSQADQISLSSLMLYFLTHADGAESRESQRQRWRGRCQPASAADKGAHARAWCTHRGALRKKPYLCFDIPSGPVRSAHLHLPQIRLHQADGGGGHILQCDI